jgi:hypothetical protein
MGLYMVGFVIIPLWFMVESRFLKRKAYYMGFEGQLCQAS